MNALRDNLMQLLFLRRLIRSMRLCNSVLVLSNQLVLQETLQYIHTTVENTLCVSVQLVRECMADSLSCLPVCLVRTFGVTLALATVSTVSLPYKES